MHAKRLSDLIASVIKAHDESSKTEMSRFRVWDKSTPYSIHPIWTAMTILTETNLPEAIRTDGAEALLLHDILEDTTSDIPECSQEVRRLVEELTFEPSEDSMELIFKRSDTAQLLKLYDKVSNFLDGSWMSPEKKAKSLADIKRLADNAKATFGNLNIVAMADALSKEDKGV